MNIIPCKLNKSKTLNPINRRNIVKSTLNAFRKLSFQTNIQHLQTLLYCMGARSKWHTTIPRFSYIHMHLNPGHRWIESDLKYYSICICTNIIPSRELYSLRSFLRIGLLWAHIFIAFILFSKCLAAIALKPNLVEISSINNISRTHTHTHTIEIEHKLCYSIYMKTTEYYNLYWAVGKTHVNVLRKSHEPNVNSNNHLPWRRDIILSSRTESSEIVRIYEKWRLFVR